MFKNMDFSRVIEVFSFQFNPETAFLFTGAEFWIFFFAFLFAYVLLESNRLVRVFSLSIVVLITSWFFQNGDLIVFGALCIFNYSFLHAILKAQKKIGWIFILLLINAIIAYYFWFKVTYFKLYFNVQPFDVWLLIIASLFILSFFKKQLLIRTIFLSIISFFFYFKASEKFVILLFASVVLNYFLGKWVFNAKGEKNKKWIVAFSVIINLLILGFFKYAYFFADSFNTMFGSNFIPKNIFAEFGNWLIGESRFSTNILVPIGVSFFTFKTISYIVDIYRKEIEPVKNLFDFAFFVSFFPALVMGPIIRARDFIPQIYKPFELTKREYSLAVIMIVSGLLKKVVMADYIAIHFIDKITSAPEAYPGFVSVMAMWGYSLQIYGDFSGYTDIAIGLSLLMGFRLLENFNSPYKAINVADFWRRWHKSLGAWLRDYLYIPLGGNRSGGLGTFIATFLIFIFLVFITQWYELFYVYGGLMLIYIIVVRFVPSARSNVYRDLNLLITLVVGGLWHGASENFVIWGAMNGVALVVFNYWKKIEIHESKKWAWIHLLKMMSVFALCYCLFFNDASNGIKFDTNSMDFWIFIQIFVVLVVLTFIMNYRSTNVKAVYQRAWAIFFTFNFITFTRIWFILEDEGEPVKMLNQIWYHFDFSLDTLFLVLHTYQSAFWIMLIGFIIHWLPTKLKDGGKNLFVKLPIPVQLIAVSCLIFLMYQAMTGDSKPFVYLQF